MNKAAKEEAKLAVELEEVDDQGCPNIAVVTDGAWSKRSYRTNYNALSGVACILGLRTKKMYGMKYVKLVGDGDSSVHRKLVESMPYGPSLVIQKIECKNHILRNYINKLREVVKNQKLRTTN
ncbi:hypothetical protein RN001_005548 [Aquatica leii]|uniref:Mutator-like transposase domain-containing protein n=1 Tax=Aquatica leii TaxID=1421715 RepID=A0AAN7Q0H6_9COLE|nr:hypothetical protein RN001_005548 [Aquatica leii]